MSLSQPLRTFLAFTGLNVALWTTINPVYDFVCDLPHWERQRLRREVRPRLSDPGFQTRAFRPWLSYPGFQNLAFRTSLGTAGDGNWFLGAFPRRSSQVQGLK